MAFVVVESVGAVGNGERAPFSIIPHAVTADAEGSK
jgi:hypothetical protein